ncbi:MAG: Glu-tRNA(Gln) amidotransferase subunit GatE [Thermoproteota archaeon]|nr:Glu-tRNA(Gln) amidotransferase subunit GatE [Thermoproteota archaeon]
MQIDYSKIGLKVGLELHQQLDTAAKLFCSCKPELFKGKPEITFLRRLRPTQSELGQIDPAAYFEFQKGVKICYEANRENTCLVEMDEEPPHNMNAEAVEIALTVALMVKATPVDEVHVMRKTVIDGSNTTGFQRTCVLALNGEINIKGKKVPIQHIGLEEDAARKMGEQDAVVQYRIDRLGIPLIEVTTAPVIYSPQEAEEVALAIGKILRATGKVKRGLGTIRQDINVSIPNGALTEIKGVQELALVSAVVEQEVQRQLGFLAIRAELKKRGVKEENIRAKFVEVTSVFEQTKSRILRKAVDQGEHVLAVKLPKFCGLLKKEIAAGMRLGSEMADRASFWGRVGGIFHTDELPAYGITSDEVEKLRRVVGGEPQDAVVFIAGTMENATDALKAVVERAKEALKGVPDETRAANPDGTTRYMRPRPGAARMYPETDVPPIQIDEKHLERLRTRLPELPEQKMKRLIKNYELNRKLVEQLLDSNYVDFFEETVQETGVSSTLAAVTLTETLKALKRDGVSVEKVSDSQLKDLFGLLSKGKIAKEAIPEVLTWFSKHKEGNAWEAVENLGLVMISQKELEQIIDVLIEENQSLVEKKGKDAFGTLMGVVMARIRGRAEAGLVSKLLRKKLGQPCG